MSEEQKIHALRNDELSVSFILGRLLELHDSIHSVVVVTRYKTGDITVNLSNQGINDLCLSKCALDEHVMRSLRWETPHKEPDPPGPG